MAHAHHHHGHLQPTAEHTGIRRRAAFIIGGLTGGHGVFHWLTQSFIVVLPEVRELILGGSLVASAQTPEAAASAEKWANIRAASIQSTREIASGLVSLPGGVLTDALRRHWGWVMAVCMALFGVGWMLMAAGGWVVPGSSWFTSQQVAAGETAASLNVAGYVLLIAGMAVVGMAASFWHLPAAAALSAQFSHRRASVLSFHGVGGNVGDVIGPVLTGLLLATLTWQAIITIYAAVPIFLAFLVLWAFRDIGQRAVAAAGSQTANTMRRQLNETKLLVGNPRIWGITTVAGLRGMAYTGFITVLPLYLVDELGLIVNRDSGTGFENLFIRGSLIGLLVLVGIFASPVMGYLSDRLGRKLVLVPGMSILAILTLLMAFYGGELAVMTVLLAGLGLFLYSDQPILTAAAMDIVREGTAATTLGLLSTSRFIFSAASPLIAGWLYSINSDNLFYYTAALYALAIIILAVLRLPRPTPSDRGGHGHGHGSGGHGHGHSHHPAAETGDAGHSAEEPGPGHRH